MVFGYVSLGMCIILLAKFIVRKSGNQRMNHIFRKFHIPFGIAILVALAVHMIMTYPVWRARANTVIISGITTFALILGMGITFLFRSKMRRNWIKIHRMLAFVIIVGVVLHVATYFVDFRSYKKSVETVKLQNVDLSKIKDGSYEGEYDVGYIKAKVEVVVKDKNIEKVTILEHVTERGKKAEKITKQIVEKQSTKVDTVSGATNSSLVIEKAVEAALLKGEQK